MNKHLQSCVDAIQKEIEENYDGTSLSDQAVKNVLKNFDIDTVSKVLAHKIICIQFDGRISSQNKQWAKSILDNTVNLDRTLDYTISSNAGLVNSFTNHFKSIELEQNIYQDEIHHADAFFYSKNNAYAIFQVKNGNDYKNVRFMSTNELNTLNIDIDANNYNLLYTDKLSTNFEENALAKIYDKFNLDLPKEFKGHSLSSSDIIGLKINDDISYHYVDSIGFKEIEKNNFVFKTTFEKQVDNDYEEHIIREVQEEIDKITTKYEVCKREQEFKGWNIKLYSGMCNGLGDSEEIIASFDTFDEAKKELEKYTSTSVELSSAWNYTQVTEYNITENQYDTENEWCGCGDVHELSKFKVDEYPFIDERSDDIQIDGHIGTWYVIDVETINRKEYFLLESEDYGDEAACLIVDREKNLVLDDVWNGFEDLHYKLEEHIAESEHEIFDKDYFYVNEKNQTVIWLYHNQDSEYSQFVKNVIEFEHFNELVTLTDAPEEFFNVYYSDRAEQYIGDLGTDLYDELKETYESGTQDFEDISEATISSLKTHTLNVNLYNQELQEDEDDELTHK